MSEIAFEGEGPSLREVHQQIMCGEAEQVTFRQQYPGEYLAVVAASGFRELALPLGVVPTHEQAKALQELLGLQTYLGPRKESGVALSGMAIYYQAMGPVMRGRSKLSTTS